MNTYTHSDSRISRWIKRYAEILLAFAFLLLWISSFLFTDDKENWAIENILVVLLVPLIVLTRTKFQFTTASYLFIFLFVSLHVIGSMYAYSSVPLGFQLQQLFQLKRNPYDRIVHFSFGCLMAYPFYDILKNKFKVTQWRTFLMPVEIVLSLSAFFELIEWVIGGVLMPGSEKTYVGSQGDPWDAQKDMAMAMLGAIITMTVYAFMHKQRSIPGRIRGFHSTPHL